MKIIRFYKETSDRWYADLPEWEGSKADLEMVCGADTMLDIMAQGENEVYLRLSLEEPTELSNTLIKIKDTPDIGGATYLMKDWKWIEYNLEIWLCDVTRFVFGSLPEIIYIN